MKPVFEITRFKFAHDSDLERHIRELAEAGRLSIQDIIDACSAAGFDGRAAATEIGILLMDGALKATPAAGRLSGSTVIAPVRPN